MARELSPAEWAALSEDERQARRRAKHQREREALTVHDVAGQRSVRFERPCSRSRPWTCYAVRD